MVIVLLFKCLVFSCLVIAIGDGFFFADKYLPGVRLSSDVSSSPVQCAAQCCRDELCKSFNYNRNKTLCILNKERTENDSVLAEFTDMVYGYFRQCTMCGGTCGSHPCPASKKCIQLSDVNYHCVDRGQYYGDSCSSQPDCVGIGTECVGGICECKKNHLYADTEDSCIESDMCDNITAKTDVFDCHCEGGAPCDKTTGKCSGGTKCERPWTLSNCQAESVSMNKPSELSSDLFNATFGVDGIGNTRTYLSACSTLQSDPAWYKVDMQDIFELSYVEIWFSWNVPATHKDLLYSFTKFFISNNTEDWLQDHKECFVVDQQREIVVRYIFSCSSPARLVIVYDDVSRYQVLVSDVKVTLCAPGTWSLNCDKRCNCFNNTRCDRYTGHCPSGCADCWHGRRCDNKPLYGDTCTNETGCHTDGAECVNSICQCEAGSHFMKEQEKCSPCPFGKFGYKCQFECHCKVDGACHPESGVCKWNFCTSPWIGANCQKRNAARFKNVTIFPEKPGGSGEHYAVDGYIYGFAADSLEATGDDAAWLAVDLENVTDLSDVQVISHHWFLDWFMVNQTLLVANDTDWQNNHELCYQHHETTKEYSVNCQTSGRFVILYKDTYRKRIYNLRDLIVYVCADGAWGDDCLDHCFCADKAACARWTGECPGDCQSGWTGPSCNITGN